MLIGVSLWPGSVSHSYLVGVEGDRFGVNPKTDLPDTTVDYTTHNMDTKRLLMSRHLEAKISVLFIYFVVSFSYVCGCEEIYFRTIDYDQKSSMSPLPTTGCSNELVHCGLLCRNDPGCRALMRMNNTIMKAECSQEPGLLQPFTVYILLKEVAVSGNTFRLN